MYVAGNLLLAQNISFKMFYSTLLCCLLLVAHAGNADDDNDTKLHDIGSISTESETPFGGKLMLKCLLTKMRVEITNDSSFADFEQLIDLSDHFQAI